MNHDGSSFCKAAGEKPQVGQEDPRSGTGDGGLEVLGETSAATEPSQAALHHPSPGQELEAFDAWRPLDDFDCPRAAIGDGIEQLRAAIDAISLRILSGVCRLIANHRSSSSSKAHQKSGSFPPPAFPSLNSTMTLSDSRPGPPHTCDVEDATSAWTGIPRLPETPFRRAVPTTPVDQNGCAHRLLPHPTRPSP